MNIVEAARALMGGIDLDPATSALGELEEEEAIPLDEVLAGHGLTRADLSG